MTRFRLMRLSVVILVLAFVAGAARAQIGTVVSNWAVPSSSSSSSSGLHHSRALADVTFGLAFIGVTPCRIVDTRGAIGPFGAPSLTAGVSRDFALPTGPCAGLPANPAAYSLNITVTNTAGPGFIKIYPQGGAVPVVSTLNYLAGQTIANAAVVPSGTSAGVTVVAGVSGTDLIIDINGYYVGKGSISPLNPGEYVGFQGNIASGVLFGWNTNTTSTGATTSAVYGYIDTPANGPAGIYAVQNSASGVNYGVHAVNRSVSSQAYGVLGESGTAGWAPVNLAAAGGRFISDGSSFNYGVIGEATTGGGLLRRTNSAGVVQTTGLIGYLGSDGLNTPNNLTVSGVKSFAEPHPTDASKVIKYVSLEGPEAGTYFRGRGRFVGGRATIEVPESFRMVTDTEGLTVQVTPMGRPAAVAVVSMGLDKIEVEATRDVEFSYLAQGVRKAFKDFQPVQNDEFYYVPEGPDAKLPGYYAEDVKQRLVANGTYLSDGSVNMATAERLGWAHNWREAEAKKRAFESRLVKKDPLDTTSSGTR